MSTPKTHYVHKGHHHTVCHRLAVEVNSVNAVHAVNCLKCRAWIITHCKACGAKYSKESIAAGKCIVNDCFTPIYGANG